MNNRLFKNKYRIASTRLKDYDYSQNGFYFVTICTKHKHPYFGKIVDGEMVLNDVGRMANNYWQEIPMHFSFVVLDEYIIMPNHLHGILVIDNDGNGTDVDGGICVGNATCRDAINRVSTDAGTITTQKTGGITGKNNPMGKKSVGSIIRWYKGRTKYESNQITPNLTWQSRFYDHIIRSNQSLHNIRQYIIDNPFKWEDDINNNGVWMQ